MLDQPGSRVPVTNPTEADGGVAIPNGAPCVIGGHVGFIEKNTQLDRWVKPGSEEATHVMPGESAVLFVLDSHELELSGALANVSVGDRLWISSQTNEVLTSAGGGESGSPKNEVQEAKVEGTAGTFNLTIPTPTGLPEALTKIDFDATAEELQALVNALDGINPGDIVVTGGPGDEGGTKPYVFTFGGRFAETDVAAITATDELTGGEEKVTISEKTKGVSSTDIAHPLGVVDSIDTARTPDVALVNLSDLKPFLTS